MRARLNVHLARDRDPVVAPAARALTSGGPDPYHATQRQSDQRRQWQRWFGANALQLKPLAKDRLNVVGERHSISDPRRAQEKEVVVHAIDKEAGYWREPELQLDDASSQPSTGAAHGDSFVLSLANLVHAIQEASQIVLGQLPRADGTVLDPEAEERLHTGFFNLRIGVDQIGPRLDAAREELRSSPGANAGPTSEAMDELAEFARSCEPGGWRTVDLDLALFRFTQKQHGQARSILAKHETDWTFKDLGTLAERIGGTKDMKSAGRARSEHMHRAAKAQAHRRGAWKVGNSHAQDLKEIREGDPGGAAYELLSAQEFQTEYGPQLPPVPDSEVIDGGRQFKWARKTLVGLLRGLAGPADPVVNEPGSEPNTLTTPKQLERIAPLGSIVDIADAACKKSGRSEPVFGKLLQATFMTTQNLEAAVARDEGLARFKDNLLRLAVFWQDAPA